MSMKVYVDLILILNFIIDFLILITISIILRRNAKLKRILLSTLVGTLSILVLFFNMNNFVLFIFKLALSILLVLIAFGYKDIKYFFNNILYFYTTSILLGGFLYYLNIQIGYKKIGLTFINNNIKLNFLVVVIFSPFILYIYIRQIKELKLFYSNRKKVNVYLDDMIIELNGYVDTGNTLIEPYSGKYVIIAHNKKIDDYSKVNNYILVPYKTLNYEGIIKCIVPKCVYIDGVGLKYDVVVGISESKIKMDGIDCLLNILMEGRI